MRVLRRRNPQAHAIQHEGDECAWNLFGRTERVARQKTEHEVFDGANDRQRGQPCVGISSQPVFPGGGGQSRRAIHDFERQLTDWTARADRRRVALLQVQPNQVGVLQHQAW